MAMPVYSACTSHSENTFALQRVTLPGEMFSTLGGSLLRVTVGRNADNSQSGRSRK